MLYYCYLLLPIHLSLDFDVHIFVSSSYKNMYIGPLHFFIVRDPAAELVYPSSVCSKPNFYAYLLVFMIRRMYIDQVAYQNVAANILN